MSSSYPRAIINEVLRLTGIGYRPRDIEKKLGVPATTQMKWAQEAGVVRGQSLDEKQKELAAKDNTPPIEDPGNKEVDAINSLTRHLKEVERSGEELQEASNKSPSQQFIPAYRQLTLPRLVDHMDRALRIPPVIKNIRDLEVLDKIIQRISGVEMGSGKNSGRLHVDVTVLECKPQGDSQRKTNGKVIDANEILDGD